LSKNYNCYELPSFKGVDNLNVGCNCSNLSYYKSISRL
jgi:hypothetical protein